MAIALIQGVAPPRMLPRAACLAAAVAIATTSASCTEPLRSHRAQQALVVDGRPDEWREVPWIYDNDRGYSMSVQHDADNLYLYVSTSDAHLRRMLGQFGVALWLDTDNQREKTRGIAFWPTQGTRAPSDEVEEQPAGGTNTRYPSLTHRGDRQPVDGSSLPEVAEHFVHGVLAYEIRLPLPVASGKALTEVQIGIEIPEPQGPASNPRRSGKGGGKQGGMGGKGGGMRGGHGQADPSGEHVKRQRARDLAPTTVWTTIELR